MHYEIRIEWDATAGVWYIEDSNIPGLVGEAATLESMMVLLRDRIPEVLEANHGAMQSDIPLRILMTSQLAQIQGAI